MAEHSKQLLDIIREAGKQPQYQEMVDYLMQRRSLPNIEQKYLGPGTYGEFAIPARARSPLPPAGVIRIHMNPTLEGGVNTLTHETTHAAERQLQKQYSEEKYPGVVGYGKNQFTDAYEKLSFNLYADKDKGRNPPQDLMQKLDRLWTAQYDDYRSTTSEARAFGVGNSTTPKNMMPPENAPPHIDSTLATEFMILLDLAKRSMKDRPQSQGR